MGTRKKDEGEKVIPGDRLLKFVESFAISTEDASALVDDYRRQASKAGRSEEKVQALVAKTIISRYAKLAATAGGATALVGVIPGLGTALAAFGGAVVDAGLCMKFQVDLCTCLAQLYRRDLSGEDARHLSFLLAVGGALESFGAKGAARIGSKAGVTLLRRYLQGAALQVVKELFKKLGVVFTRKALEKALPFGVGVAISGTTNYYLTKFVGTQAIKWFVLDAEDRAGTASGP